MTLPDIGPSIVIAILSLILGALITRYYATRRRINIVVPSAFNLVDLSRVAKEKIQILCNNKPIENLWVVRIVIQNRGNIDVESSAIRANPTLSFGESIEIIDIEQRHVGEENQVKATIRDTRFAEFKIDYLKRREQAAFQILVHSPKGDNFSPKDLSVAAGIIDNTDIHLANLAAGAMPATFTGVAKVIRKYRKLIGWAYLLLSLILILVGITDLYDPSLLNLSKTTQSTFPVPSRWKGTIPLVYGLVLLMPTILLIRKLRYLDLFSKDIDKE